jgi:hypothetical protein
MTNELSTPQVCLLLRADVELWIPAERRDALEAALSDKDKRFVKVNGQVVNPLEVVGIFTPDYMEERTRRKNGQWRCQKNTWHDKGQQCHCREYKETVTAIVRETGEVINYKR